MFPLGDNNSDRTVTPIVNYVLLALNILAFLVWQRMGNDESVILRFATVPAGDRDGQRCNYGHARTHTHSGISYPDHFYVHAWRLGTSGW